MDLTVSFDEASVLVDNLAYLLKAIEVRDHNLWGHTFMRPHKMTDFVTLPPTPTPPEVFKIYSPHFEKGGVQTMEIDHATSKYCMDFFF